MAERSRSRHPFLASMGLVLLAPPGFALGVLAGVAWEEPGMLAGHLLGRSVDAPWGQVAGGRPASESVPAAQPEPLAPPAPAPRRAARTELPPVAAPSPAPKPEAPAAPATRLRPGVLSPDSAERFAVQVGAFSESHAAEALVERLRRIGFEAYVSPSAVPGQARWRVRVGPVASREQAEGVAARLKAEQKLPTWVLDENAV